MARTVYDNLQPGEHFAASIANLSGAGGGRFGSIASAASMLDIAGAPGCRRRSHRSPPRMASLRDLARALRGRLRPRRDHGAIFGEIFRRNLWGDAESVSGPGSTRARGADFSADLVAVLRRLEARILLDAPCGDFNWIAEAADAVEQYIGMDVVPELIAHNLRHHRSASRSFARADITRDPLPAADVILCRDCLVHFSYRDVWATLANFQRSGSRYLLTTTFVSRGRNEDIPTGGWRPLNLEAPPFRFPPTLEVVDERCLHTGGIYRDKRLALWELSSLPARSAAW